MDRLLSIAAAALGELGPADAVSVAATSGFGGAGIWFDPATWTTATTAEVRRRLDATGVVALDVEPVILSRSGDPGDALVDTAVALGARHVLVASRHPDRAATIDRFGELCDRAAAGGVTCVLEFLPVFAVGNLAAALGVVRAAGRRNGAVLVDSLHLARSCGTPAGVGELAAAEPALFPYLQIADAPAQRPDDLYDEAVNGRLLPGEGGLPLADLLLAVPSVPLSLELRSRALRDAYPDPQRRATEILAATRRLLALVR